MDLIGLLPDNLARALRNRFAPDPIVTVDGVADFVQTRAAYVAQTSLFGYLKARMGTSYPKYFEDEAFSASIRSSQGKIFRACAADLAIFTAAVTAQHGGLSSSEASRLAVQCFSYALNNCGVDFGEAVPDWNARFAERAKGTLWPQAALGANAFTESPAELVDAAPVIDEFKRQDAEIVQNSIRFRWRDVREQYSKRSDHSAICDDFRAHSGSASQGENAVAAPK
jgi:hypothetical protein